MATSTPKPESILADVATKLALITVANSFRNTVAKVDRQFINPQTIGAGALLPALAVYGESIDFETSTIGLTPRQTGRLQFKIQGMMKAYTAPATALMGFIQDVREKLFEDRSRGGYADLTIISRVEMGGEGFAGSFGNPPFVNKPFIGFLMELEVQYQENL